MSDVGVGDQQFFTRTHLGRWLNVGDSVLGYDVANSNVNNYEIEKIKPENRPDVVLVRKMYDRQKRNRRRKWKLRHMDGAEHMDTASQERDYTEFLEDLEEDDIYRQNINLYKDTKKFEGAEFSETDDEEAPCVGIEEMLDDLDLDTKKFEGAEFSETDDEEAPCVGIEEMLDDLHLDDHDLGEQAMDADEGT